MCIPDIYRMKFKNETIYIKAKELRELINEALCSSAYEDAHLREKLSKLSLQIPFLIGLGLNLYSIECTRDHFEKIEKKLIELCIAVDLSTTEYFKIESTKLDYLVEEIFELIPIVLEKAEEDEKKRMDEIMKEFMMTEA